MDWRVNIQGRVESGLASLEFHGRVIENEGSSSLSMRLSNISLPTTLPFVKENS